jgi:hypothetical protein
MRKRIGNAGEPCGIPVCIGHWISVWPSKDSAVVHLLRKEEHHDVTAPGQPRAYIVVSNQAEDMLLKAPQISKNRDDVTKPCFVFTSTLCISTIAVSIANHLGWLLI